MQTQHPVSANPQTKPTEFQTSAMNAQHGIGVKSYTGLVAKTAHILQCVVSCRFSSQSGQVICSGALVCVHWDEILRGKSHCNMLTVLIRKKVWDQYVIIEQQPFLVLYLGLPRCANLLHLSRSSTILRW